MFYIYILQSLKDKKTYVGYSKDVNTRFIQHCNGEVKSTAYRRPLQLVFTEEFKTSQEAKKRELWWKSGAGRRKLKELFDNGFKRV